MSVPAQLTWMPGKLALSELADALNKVIIRSRMTSRDQKIGRKKTGGCEVVNSPFRKLTRVYAYNERMNE